MQCSLQVISAALGINIVPNANACAFNPWTLLTEQSARCNGEITMATDFVFMLHLPDGNAGKIDEANWFLEESFEGHFLEMDRPGPILQLLAPDAAGGDAPFTLPIFISGCYLNLHRWQLMHTKPEPHHHPDEWSFWWEGAFLQALAAVSWPHPESVQLIAHPYDYFEFGFHVVHLDGSAAPGMRRPLSSDGTIANLNLAPVEVEKTAKTHLIAGATPTFLGKGDRYYQSMLRYFDQGDPALHDRRPKIIDLHYEVLLGAYEDFSLEDFLAYVDRTESYWAFTSRRLIFQEDGDSLLRTVKWPLSDLDE